MVEPTEEQPSHQENNENNNVEDYDEKNEKLPNKEMDDQIDGKKYVHNTIRIARFLWIRLTNERTDGRTDGRPHGRQTGF